MPKLFGKDIPTWMVGAAALIGGAVVYSALPSDDAPATASKAKPAAKKKDGNDVYLPIDHTIRFANFTDPVDNSFKPLVAKPLSGGVGQSGPVGFSPAWAGGEANWSYTGYLLVNNAAQGLLEKSDTGEGDYVSVGDHWKHSLISKITPDSMTIVADDGPHVVKLGDASEQKEKGGVVAATIAPVNPLQGQIGAQGGFAQQGNGINPADVMAVPDPTAFPQTGQGGRGGRGGRRGRGGGGGFGGGGFGGG